MAIPPAESRVKATTLEDVAKVAGVTAMTVSRVMKGKANVSPATRELVLRIAEELNYTVNLSARALKTGRSGTVAIISGGLDQPYSANIVSILDSQLNASGYQMKLMHTRGAVKNLILSGSSAGVDGVIVAGMHGYINEFRAEKLELYQPSVQVGIDKPGYADYVHSNLVPAVEQALQLMIASGRKRVAYVSIGIPAESFTVFDTEIRTQTYVATMTKSGRQPELISAAPSYEVAGAERVENLKAYIQKHGCPDGLLCVNDDVAIHVYRSLMDLKIRIPEDVSLVGCDGLPVLEFFEPPLSTIAQPMAQMCAKAWEFLQARIENPQLPIQQANFDAELIVRRSLQI